MKMIVHHHQEEICLRIEKMKTIPVMAIIKETSQELSFSKAAKLNLCPSILPTTLSVLKKGFFILLEF
ncbi:MAG: hypothetical protein M3O68_06605 [Thermoproteota archaeon]|nr:hypothetical protein [Thermoproteota archaeon]